MKVTCEICKREREEETCEVFTLTAEERQILLKQGETPQERYVYCRPCMRLLKDPVTALQLIKGVVQVQATAMGAVNAEAVAEKFANKLLAKSKIPNR